MTPGDIEDLLLAYEADVAVWTRTPDKYNYAEVVANRKKIADLLEARTPQEATGLQCEKDGVCALVSRNDDEWHCTACNGDFVRKQPVEPAPDYLATLYALLVRRGYAQHEAHSLAYDEVLPLTEVALNQGPRLAEGVGSNPEVGAHHRLSPPPPDVQAWVPVSERLPESSLPVLAFVTNSNGKTRRLRAHWIAKHTDEMWDGDMDGDYSEETDTTYTPEGWYETNEYEDTHWRIHDPVTHWMPLPSPPQAKEGGL